MPFDLAIACTAAAYHAAGSATIYKTYAVIFCVISYRRLFGLEDHHRVHDSGPDVHLPAARRARICLIFDKFFGVLSVRVRLTIAFTFVMATINLPPRPV